MESRHGVAAREVQGRPRRSGGRPWAGALGYIAAQAVISLLGFSWGPLGWGLEGQLMLLMASLAVLVVAGYVPGPLGHRALQYLLLSLGWPFVAGAAGVAWHEPYVFITESQWLGHGSSRAVLHPFFTLGLSVLLFLAALGHTVPFTPWRRRLLCMDAPLLGFMVLCLVLHLRGYPSFEG
jgi:hypothetical protein